MTYYDHEAVRKAYPNACIIKDTIGVFSDDGITEIVIDQALVDNARATLDAESAAVKYKEDRAKEYPDWGTQLDYIYHNGIDKWKTDIVDPVKAKYPKPS